MNKTKVLFIFLVIVIVGFAGIYMLRDNEPTRPASTSSNKVNQPLSTFTPPPVSNDLSVTTPDESINEPFVSDAWDAQLQDNPISQTPSAFVQQYFGDLKNVPYEQTWAMLSADFQAQNSLPKYIKWWSKNVDSVYVDEIVSADGQQVTVRLQYQMKNGRSVCSKDTFSLLKSGESWLIDKQKYRNCKR